jgi:8-oxo-dGTP pyrophosphatase MutT (NUDIX family)
MINKLIPKLVNRLGETLPGEEAFKKLSPISVKQYRIPTKDYTPAGVMSLIYPKDGHAHLLFMKRTSMHPNDKHAGQISFPGGKRDPEDEDMKACAIRECWEEVGVSQDKYTILGELSELYISVSNFLIQPYLAFAKNPLDFEIETKEVLELIEFPLAHLLDYKNLDVTEILVRGYKMKNVPYFDLNGQVLWGATSMITSEIIHLMQELEVRPKDLIY